MKIFASLIGTASIGFLLLAQSRDISGTWVAKISSHQAGDSEVVFDLKMDAQGKITGTQRLPFGDSPIVDGKLDGDKVELTVDTGTAASPAKGTASGTLVGNELHITPALPAFGGGRGAGGAGGAGGRGGGRAAMFAQPLVARIGTPTPTYRAPALDYTTLPKIDLPAPHDVPYNGLAKTPPMGWNSWNKFRTKIDDRTVREIADAMVSSGMRDAGYRYVNIDDGWQWKRDEKGEIVPNPNFPNMNALASYVHSKGLMLGIYSSPGPRTCAGYEGSYGHEEQDARTYASWGIDYLKYDWCSASRVWKDEDMRAAYQKMGDALRKAGDRIVYSLCQYGRANAGEWGPRVGGNLWRTTGDIRDTWQSMSQIGFSQSDLAKFTRPGWWPDSDMLEIGNGGMTPTEYRTHLSLWAMISAPLIAGNDLRSMTPEIRDILTNKEVIAVNQDKLGQGGRMISKNGETEVWAKALVNGYTAIGLFNRGAEETEVAVKWQDAGIHGAPKVHDLWAHTEVGSKPEGFSAKVPSHGVVMLRAK